MKKLFAFFAAVLFTGSMMAAVTLLPGDFSAATNAATSASKGGVNVAITTGTITSDQIRIFKDQTVTFTSESTITTIVFKCTASGTDQYGPGCFGAQTGYSYDGNTGTWTGSSNSVSFKAATSQVRATQIVVYLNGEVPPTVVYDTLTVAEAITACAALDSAASSQQEVFVEGYVVNADPFSPSYKNQTFFMSDDPAVKDSTFEAYGALPLIGEAKDTIQLYDGDKVRAFGFLKRYYDKNTKSFQLELSNPKVEVLDTVPGKDRSLPDIPTITVARALEIGGALASNSVSPEYYVVEGYVSYIDAFFSEDFGNETFYISDDQTQRTKNNAFEVYRGKPNTEKEIGLGAKVSVKCKIKNYSGTIENDGSNIAFDVIEASTFVPDTLDIDEAVTTALAVSGNNVATPVYYVVKGFVNEVQTVYSSKYNNATFTMAQYPNEASGALKAYQASILKADSNKVKTAGKAPSDLYVHVMGYLTKYNTSAQLVKGSHVAFVEAPVIVFDTISAADADSIARSLLVNGQKRVTVKAYIAKTGEYDEGKISVWLNDDPSSTYGVIQAYKAIASDEYGPACKHGDLVLVEGSVSHTVNPDDETKHYYQIAAGAQLTLLEAGPSQGIENIVLTEKAQKVVVDGVVYIIRDNKMYDIMGVQVR